jgi:transcriptional regulator with XRE-family HTH domain
MKFLLLKGSNNLFNKMTFGKCLKLLLTTLNIPMSHLAKAINVDNSLVSRWVHEKRIPSYVASYIDNIAEYLSRKLLNTYQIKILDELYYDLIEHDHVREITNSEKIRALLYDSLNYSIECKKKEKTVANTSKNKTSISPNANMIDIPQTSVTNSVDLSGNDKIIYGISNIFSVAISLLEMAIRHKRKDNNIIYITICNYLDNSFFSDNRILYIRKLLLKAIENGWKVYFLLRIDNNVERILRFIHFLLPVAGTGNVYIYYFNKYDVFMPGKEMYIVSGIGALSCYPAGQSLVINCGFYLRNKSAIDIFTNYINLLIQNNAQNVIKYYPEETNEEYHCSLSEVIGKPGNQYDYNSNFSMCYLSEKLYRKFLWKTKLSQQEKLLSLQHYKKQRNGIVANLENHKCNSIYFSESLELLMNNRILCLYTYFGIEKVKLGVQDLIEYLQHVIHFITEYDNFQVAVIFQDTNLVKNNGCSYIIKERRAVYFNSFGSFESTAEVRLSIEEPMTVKAFSEYFNMVWDKISPVNKDKDEIITWLQSYITILDKKN